MEIKISKLQTCAVGGRTTKNELSVHLYDYELHEDLDPVFLIQRCISILDAEESQCRAGSSERPTK